MDAHGPPPINGFQKEAALGIGEGAPKPIPSNALSDVVELIRRGGAVDEVINERSVPRECAGVELGAPVRPKFAHCLD